MLRHVARSSQKVRFLPTQSPCTASDPQDQHVVLAPVAGYDDVKTLLTITRYQISGEHMDMLDDNGDIVARFQAVALQ